MTQWESSDATEVIPVVDPSVDPSANATVPPAGSLVPVPAGDPAAAPADDPAGALAPPDREHVTCPECGAAAVVTTNRRQAEDFCRHCDFPLFWTPSLVILESGGLNEDSLRRLPGTTGRAMTASLACPHCAEPNPVTAVDCVRCGLPMHVEAPPPPPAPVYVAPPPPPAPAPPVKRTPWWVWLLLGLLVTAAIVLGILWGTGVFN